jgi:hypothetical protein
MMDDYKYMNKNSDGTYMNENMSSLRNYSANWEINRWWSESEEHR